jgi:hypothetical protein
MPHHTLYSIMGHRDAGVRALARGCRRLESLNVTACSQLSDASITVRHAMSVANAPLTTSFAQAVAQYCPRMQRLVLRGCFGLTDALFAPLAVLPVTYLVVWLPPLRRELTQRRWRSAEPRVLSASRRRTLLHVCPGQDVCSPQPRPAQHRRVGRSAAGRRRGAAMRRGLLSSEADDRGPHASTARSWRSSTFGTAT